MSAQLKRPALIVLLAFLVTSVAGVAYFGRGNIAYEVASDTEMAEFSDSAAAALFERGDIERLRRSAALDEAFDAVVDAQTDATAHSYVFSRNVIRRSSDALSIRFGETRGCERALIFDDDTVVCDHELYFALSGAIDASS